MTSLRQGELPQVLFTEIFNLTQEYSGLITAFTTRNFTFQMPRFTEKARWESVGQKFLTELQNMSSQLTNLDG